LRLARREGIDEAPGGEGGIHFQRNGFFDGKEKKGGIFFFPLKKHVGGFRAASRPRIFRHMKTTQ
jgi:hypothetical protein